MITRFPCLSVLTLTGFVLLGSLAQSEEPKDGPVKKGKQGESISVRTLLEKGAASHSFPKGMVVRVEACLGEADARVPADARELIERWEFTADQVHRIGLHYKDKGPFYDRLESRPFDGKGICKDLLDGRALEIRDRKGTGPKTVLAGTPYHRGSRSIEVEWNGETILNLHETNGPALDAYQETDAKSFGKLYEQLANQARALLGPKAGEISNLHWQKSGMVEKFGGIVPWPLEINEAVPNGLKIRPKGLVAPRYGVFDLGPTGRAVSTFVILDGPKGQPGTLYVNSKADGAMITGPGHPMTLKTGTYIDGSEWARYSTGVSVEIPFAGGNREANLIFLRLDPKKWPDKYESCLALAADFGYAGTANINGKPVPTMVLDTSCTGEISLTDGRRHRPRFWFDINRDGKRDPGEVVEQSDSFLFDGQWWAVASMGNDGTIRIVSPETPVSFDEKKCFSKEQARALEDYLTAHPNARHFRVGLRQLFMHYRDEANDKGKALATLEREYEYLVAKAKAKELKEGLRFQFLACVGIEAEDRALIALEREHAFLIRESPRDFVALGQNLNDRVYRLTKSNQPAEVAKAGELISRAKEEFARDSNSERVSQLFAKCRGMCNKPAIGGTLKLGFNALDGTRVDLADMRGKVVLIDFWATWCAPCVASQPGIKAAYDKYHNKGFEVIGISLDGADSKDKVINFLKGKQLPWPQSFDGKGWDTPLAVACGITELPTTFLIGKDGRILCINVHGVELEARLAELLR